MRKYGLPEWREARHSSTFAATRYLLLFTFYLKVTVKLNVPITGRLFVPSRRRRETLRRVGLCGAQVSAGRTEYSGAHHVGGLNLGHFGGLGHVGLLSGTDS